MAIFGTLNQIEAQANPQAFQVALAYLATLLDPTSTPAKRLRSLQGGAFEKVPLAGEDFALEQVYDSKPASDCFFESHRDYIDVQFILEGEEVIRVAHRENLTIEMPYDASMDLIKYHDTTDYSEITLHAGDIAIFYPDDAHMPCVQVGTPTKVVKSVVKVAYHG